MVTRVQRAGNVLEAFDRKANSAAYLCGAQRLKVQQEFLEKTQSILVSSLKSLDAHQQDDITNMHLNLERKRLEETEKLSDRLSSVASALKELKKNMSAEKIKQIDTEDFKNQLVDLELKISDMKEVNEREYSQLCYQETAIWEHISAAEYRIDEWAKPVRVECVFPGQTRNSFFSAGSHYNESVNKFQKFLLEKGGHTGGWEESDHLLYVRLRRKHHNKKAFFSHLLMEFPDKTTNDIYKHDEWFHEYENLRSQQKKAIAEWRAHKSHLSAPAASDSLSGVTRVGQARQRHTLSEVARASRLQQKQQIEDWKRMKAMQQHLKQLKKEEDRQKMLAEEEMKHARMELQKAELERLKEEKFKKKHALEVAKLAQERIDAERRAAQANRSLKAFRSRDQESGFRQQEIRKSQRHEQEVRERVLEQIRQTVRVQGKRDPARLLKPTDAWQQRVRQKGDAAKLPQKALSMTAMPHLRVPEWRKCQT